MYMDNKKKNNFNIIISSPYKDKKNKLHQTNKQKYNPVVNNLKNTERGSTCSVEIIYSTNPSN